MTPDPEIRVLQPRLGMVTAIQYTGSNADKIGEFLGPLPLEADLMIGDWVVKGSNGSAQRIPAALQATLFEDIGTYAGEA